MKGSTKGSEFIFGCLQLLYYKCHKISSNLGGSYIEYSDWIKNKKASISPIDKKNAFKKIKIAFNNCCNSALDYEKIKEHPERITKIKTLVPNYN